MAASVKLYGDTYNYTISNIQNSISCTPSNRNSRYGAVYSKPTVTINKKHACTRYIWLSVDASIDTSDRDFAIYKAVFSSSSTTATVTEVQTTSVVPLGIFARFLARQAKSSLTNTAFISISTSSSTGDVFDGATFNFSISASGWNPSSPTLNYTTSQSETGDPDPSVFGLIAGYAKASWAASGNTTWSYSLNGFSGTINPSQTLSLSANGASATSAAGTGTRSASLAAKLLSATSVTGTAKLTNTIGGSATTTKTVTVQSYSKPTTKSLAVGRVTVNNEKHASMSIGWAVNELNKQSTASQLIRSGAITCTWECVDLSNMGVLFSSGEFDIVSDGDAMTVLTDTTTAILVDTSGNGNDEYDPDKSFRFTAYITDRINRTSLTISAILASEFYLICAREGGRGIGFGMVPPDDAMHVNMPATFYDDVSVTGDVTATGDVTDGAGNTLSAVAASVPVIAVETKTLATSVNVSANSTTSSYNIPTKSGYTIAAVTPMVTGSYNGQYFAAITTSDNNVPTSLYFKNTHSSAHTNSFYIRVVYIKN